MENILELNHRDGIAGRDVLVKKLSGVSDDSRRDIFEMEMSDVLGF